MLTRIGNLDLLYRNEEKGILCTPLEVNDQFLDIISTKCCPIDGALASLWLSAQVEFK